MTFDGTYQSCDDDGNPITVQMKPLPDGGWLITTVPRTVFWFAADGYIDEHRQVTALVSYGPLIPTEVRVVESTRVARWRLDPEGEQAWVRAHPLGSAFEITCCHITRMED